ncbi:MAG: hypothetical protein JSU78_00275, partial [Deltaproteobacteria bacterium]
MSSITLQYPVPRQPKFPQEVASVDELMPGARKSIERTVGRGALGVLKPDDTALFIYPPNQDEMVLKALVAAVKEKGITVECVGEHEIIGEPLEKFTPVSAEDAWLELNWRKEAEDMLGLAPIMQNEQLLWPLLESFMDRNPKYSAVFVGGGGRGQHRTAMGKHGSKFKDNWIFTNCEHMLSRLEDFPGEVQALIERKIMDLLPRVSEVKITDPQGTDISFSVTAEQASVWGKVQLTGHLFMYPSQSITTAHQLGLEFAI